MVWHDAAIICPKPAEIHGHPRGSQQRPPRFKMMGVKIIPSLDQFRPEPHNQ